MGRYYGMDRESQWGRVKKAYDAMVYREGIRAADPVKAVEESYRTLDPEASTPPTNLWCPQSSRAEKPSKTGTA